MELATLELHTSAIEYGSSLPTLTAQDYGSNQGGAAGRVGEVRESLSTMARRGTWPTPTASDAYGSGNRNLAGSKAHTGTSLTDAVNGGQWSPTPDRPRGKLNPEWVAWLMGWPIGWTGLEPLATARFQQWQRLHGVCLGGR